MGILLTAGVPAPYSQVGPAWCLPGSSLGTGALHALSPGQWQGAAVRAGSHLRHPPHLTTSALSWEPRPWKVAGPWKVSAAGGLWAPLQLGHSPVGSDGLRGAGKSAQAATPDLVGSRAGPLVPRQGEALRYRGHRPWMASERHCLALAPCQPSSHLMLTDVFGLLFVPKLSALSGEAASFSGARLPRPSAQGWRVVWQGRGAAHGAHPCMRSREPVALPRGWNETV